MFHINVLFMLFFCIDNGWIMADADYGARNRNDKPEKKNFSPDMSEKEILQNINYYFKEYTQYYFLQFPTFERREVALATFIGNLHKLNKMNKRKSSALFKVNEYTILTLDKFKSMYTGFRDVDNMDEGQKIYDFNIEITDLPSSLDYRDILMHDFAVDQGECKSSYVFSSIGNIEAQVMKNFHFYPNLSMQFAYECEPTGDCFQGGLPHLVMEALMKTPGIVETTNYASYYQSAKLKKCKINEETAIIKVTGVYRFKVAKEDYLKHALALYGPLVIAIYVGEEIKNYHSGVLQPMHCNGKPDHAVLLSGYGVTEDNIQYWIVKNSWGPDWGEKGFFRIIQGEWACGIGSYIVTATVDINYENNLTVTPIILPQKNMSLSITLPVPKDTEEAVEVNSLPNHGVTLIDSYLSELKKYSDKADVPENLDLRIEKIYQAHIQKSSPIQHSAIDSSIFMTVPHTKSIERTTIKPQKMQKNTHSMPIFATNYKEDVPSHKEITHSHHKMHHLTTKRKQRDKVKLKIVVNKNEYGDLRFQEIGKMGPHHLDEVIVLESTEAKTDVPDMSNDDFEILNTPNKKKYVLVTKHMHDDVESTKIIASDYVKTLTKLTYTMHTIMPYTMVGLEKESSRTKQAKEKPNRYILITRRPTANDTGKVVIDRLRKKLKSIYLQNRTEFKKETTKIRNKATSRGKKNNTNKNRYDSTKQKRQKHYQNNQNRNTYLHLRYNKKKVLTKSMQTSPFYYVTRIHKRKSTSRHKKYILIVENNESSNDKSVVNDNDKEDVTTESSHFIMKHENVKNSKESEIVFKKQKKNFKTSKESEIVFKKHKDNEENSEDSEVVLKKHKGNVKNSDESVMVFKKYKKNAQNSHELETVFKKHKERKFTQSMTQLFYEDEFKTEENKEFEQTEPTQAKYYTDSFLNTYKQGIKPTVKYTTMNDYGGTYL